MVRPCPGADTREHRRCPPPTVSRVWTPCRASIYADPQAPARPPENPTAPTPSADRERHERRRLRTSSSSAGDHPAEGGPGRPAPGGSKTCRREFRIERVLFSPVWREGTAIVREIIRCDAAVRRAGRTDIGRPVVRGHVAMGGQAKVRIIRADDRKIFQIGRSSG